MNKAQLVEAVASKAELSKAAARRAVDAVFSAISEALSNGENVQLVGFGTFTVTERKARKGRNPRTGEVITIPARKVVRFRPGKQLQEMVS